ncbi:tRNA (cytidine(34)-2'-O)-methyltransferase [Uliginosibacterium sp. sgz301328]|uniref:tRNA (cytidine(34)-2'-O)-methyltransferase n=1 Tax=Uliginosibacterium sp. sgz301328 TaxID=3243764 RepID=UPI00359D7A89
MFHVVLHQPEIPPNTGNVMRLCANAGVRLHLVEPLGFELSDKHLARAGMDYRDLVNVTVHPDWESCRAALEGHRFFALTTRASRPYGEIEYLPGDVFVFGAESQGLPEHVRESFPAERRLRIPMRPGSRSLNLSNSVAVVVYEAWRQQGYALGE